MLFKHDFTIIISWLIYLMSFGRLKRTLGWNLGDIPTVETGREKSTRNWSLLHIFISGPQGGIMGTFQLLSLLEGCSVADCCTLLV